MWAGKGGEVHGVVVPLYFVLEDNGMVTLEDRARTCGVGGVGGMGHVGVPQESALRNPATLGSLRMVGQEGDGGWREDGAGGR